MSDVSAVHTQIAKGSSGNAVHTHGTKSNAAAADTKGLNFFDLLITRVTEQQDTDETQPVTQTATADTTLDADTAKALKDALESLLQGLPADQRPVTVKLDAGQLKKILQKLTVDAGDINAKQQALIATGLTPEQLTKLSALMASGDTQDIDDKDLKAIMIGILKLVQDGEKPGAVIFPKTLMASKEEKTKDTEKETDKDDVDSSLTTLCAVPQPVVTTQLGETADPSLNSNGLKKAAGGFNEVLRLMEQMQTKGNADAAALPVPTAKTADATPAPGPVNSTMGANFDALLGSLTSDEALNGLFPDGLNWSKDNQYGISNVQANGPAQLTSLVTQAPSAGQSHPATQVVIATMVKTAQGGEAKSMTLRLDPAELGKIEIHMQFTKDKSIKTHMIFEKPETMLMMQRDSHALENAMRNAGMDGGDSGLSFELAGHDHAFDGGSGNNNGGNSGSGKTGTENAMLIETTMSWSVDAETGLNHYNVLV